MITTLCVLFTFLCPVTGNHDHKPQAQITQQHHHIHHSRRATTFHKSNVSVRVTKHHAHTSTTKIENDKLFEQFKAWCYIHHPGECDASGRN